MPESPSDEIFRRRCNFVLPEAGKNCTIVGMSAQDEPDPTRSPGTVIAAAAAATVVAPFLTVYAFLFLIHGLFVNVEQPDVTGSRHGEALAGLVALVFLFVVIIGIARLINGRDRWLLVAGQLVTAAVSVLFLIDTSFGDRQVPAVVLLTSLAAIVLAVLPASWRWVATDGGERLPRHSAEPAHQS